MKPPHWLCLLFLASILVASSAVVTVVSPEETTAPKKKAAWAAMTAPVVQPDEAFLARLCEQQRGAPLPWCRHLNAGRRGAHRYLPTPPPGHGGGEEIDPRFGVSKRLVPSGPNRLHN